MDDPIFDSPTETPAPAAPPPPPPAAEPDPRIERLENMVGSLVGKLDELARTPAPVAEAPPPPPKPTNDQLTDLAANPRDYIAQIARETATQHTNETLAPLVMQTLTNASQSLLNNHSTQVDAQFGAGTWDEMFRPQLEQDLARLKQANPQAMADSGTVEALVNRLYGGGNFNKLMERRGAHAAELTKQEEAGIAKIVSHLPQGGVPRLRSTKEGTELPEDVEQFLKTVDAKTGSTTDRKSYGKLYEAGTESGRGHRTDVLEYLKAVGASPDTVKSYGGG